MPLSYFVLMLWVFLTSTVQLGWWTVDGRLLGFIGLAAVVIFVLESLSVVTWRVPGRRV
jgi:NADH:ubiquinone oxidoreductase subunit 3 (subunit A)